MSNNRFLRTFAAGLSGVIFGLGLVISGMTDPAKVLNFLDLAGTWDPSLAFVMAGAIAVTSPFYAQLTKPLFDASLHWPTAKLIDPPLVLGAALFGVGWGLIGLCPGPAIASLSQATNGVLAFAAAMLAGMAIARHTPPIKGFAV